MSNPFFTASGAPVAAGRGLSAALRSEFANIETAFDGVYNSIDVTQVSGTSTTSLTIGAGNKSLTIQTGKAFYSGQMVAIAYTTTPYNRMVGTVSTYDSTTGALVVAVTDTYGSGTYAAWTVSFTVLPNNPIVNMPTGANIASAATLNLDSATGNRVHVTGTTTITAVTLTQGPRTVIFDGALTLTHNATTNNLPGGLNITTAAGDRAVYESDGTTVYCVAYIKADGSVLGAGNHEITVSTPNGYGATSTKIARWTTTQSSSGSITYADNANTGGSFTCVVPGLYELCLMGPFGATAALHIGASLNTTTPTTNIEAIAASERVLYGRWDNTVNSAFSMTKVVRLVAGDVIRVHGNGNALGTSVLTTFSMRRIGA